jgi:hypothetical protein
MRRTLQHLYHWAVFISECHWCKILSESSYAQNVSFAFVVRAPVHCTFVDKQLNIYINYFVTVLRCSLRPPLTTVFRQNAGRGCECVKGLQCGSPLGLRNRDPPIIQVEIPTLSRQFVALYWFRICSFSHESVSAYAQHVMKFVPQMISMRWNRFNLCSACILMSM